MTSILRYAFVFSASIVAATAPGLAAEPVETAIADLVSTVDAATDWSAAYRDLSYDSATDTAVLTGLTVENSVIGVEVNFQPISIVGYAEAPDGTFDARTISSDGASISNEGLAASIAAIRYDGLGNVPTDFSSFPAWDSQRPFTSMIRAYAPFVDIQLAHGEIGSISIDVKRPTSESSTSYKDLSIDGWANGKIASITSGGMTIEATTPDGPVTVKVDTVAALDMDYAAMLRIYDPDQYVDGVGDNIWRNAAKSLSYKDITIETSGGNISIGSVAADDFKVRQPERNFNDFFDRALLDPESQPEPTPEELRALFGYASAFSLGTLSTRDIVVKAPDGGSGHVDSVMLSDFSHNGIGEFAIEGFAAESPSRDYVKFGRFAFGGLTFPSIEFLFDAMEAEKTGREPDFTKLGVELAFYELLDLDVDVPESPRVQMEKGRIDLGNYVGPTPTDVLLEISGVDVPATLIEDPMIRAVWQSLGYDRIQADLIAKLAWNEGDKTIVVDDFSITVGDVASVSLNAVVSGLTREALEDIQNIAQSADKLAFVGGSLSIEKYDILDRWIDMQAATTGADAATVRLQVAALVSGVTAVVGETDFRAQLQRVLQAAIMTPGPVTATAAPAAPVPIALLAVLGQTAPAGLPDLLGLTIENSASASPAGQQ